MKTVEIKINLKPLMEKRGVNQEELSQAIEVPQGTISRWVNNRVDRYDRRILEKLMVFFNCDLEDLFGIRVIEA